MHLLVTVTCPKSGAEKLAQEVLKHRLGACVNMLDGVHSTYWWKGKLESADESLLLFKTRSDLFKNLERTVKRIHPYETPEIVAFKIEKGSRDYLEWMTKETSPTSKEIRSK